MEASELSFLCFTDLKPKGQRGQGTRLRTHSKRGRSQARTRAPGSQVDILLWSMQPLGSAHLIRSFGYAGCYVGLSPDGSYPKNFLPAARSTKTLWLLSDTESGFSHKEDPHRALASVLRGPLSGTAPGPGRLWHKDLIV